MKTNNEKNKPGKKHHFDALKELTAGHLKKNPRKSYSARQLLKAIQAGNDKSDIEQVLSRLVQTRRVTEVRKGQFQYGQGSGNRSSRGKTSGNGDIAIEGRLEVIRSGAAYLLSDQSAQDVYIPAKYLQGAIHGDIVKVQVEGGRKKRPEGRVVQILKRETHYFVGTFHHRRNIHIVYPDSEHHRLEIHVRNQDSMDARDGDKVIVHILAWRDEAHRFPTGKVTQVLRADALIDNEMMGTLINHGFPLVFSDEALEIARKAAEGMQDGLAWPDRRDFRQVTTFTIDPLTAKDFDDAISFQRLDNGHLEIGIHIADASHYLEEGTVLDKEAYAKSTSVYLVDRALPMLPEVLSSDICSLNPLCDRLTFSVVFTLDPSHYKITGTWIGKSVIHSNHRFVYEDAQEVLDRGDGIFHEELNLLNKIAVHFRKKRFAEGSIGFESPEYRFDLDPVSGKPVSVREKTRIDTHILVEEYMLMANRAVAEFINNKEKSQDSIPFVYRVHDLPDLDKLSDLALFAKEMGFELRMNTPKEITRSLNALYEASATNDSLKILQPLAIRTMAKAEYSTNNIGHYGLAFDLYSHFTSPIRRYSDILAHRILAKNLNQTFRADKKRLEEQCKYISNQERKAMEAERDSVKFFQLLYIADHVGQEFTGKISGLIERGIFTELDDNHVEGFIAFEEMDEPFILAASRLKVMGRRSGTVLSMGDRIKVRIESAELSSKRVQMAFVGKVSQ